MDVVQVTVGGARLQLSRDAVTRAVARGGFGPVRQHAVEVDGVSYPVKEVFARATGFNLLDFNTVQARGTLRRLGFPVTPGVGGAAAIETGQQRNTNRDRILELLARTTTPLDDDEIADRLNIYPRQTVNQACREMSRDGVIERRKEPGSKIVNSLRRT